MPPADTIAADGAPTAAATRTWRSRVRLDRGWAWWTVALIGWAMIPLAVALIHVLRHGGVLTGTDATIAGADQQQYMSAIRQSGDHLLIANQFRLGPSTALFLNPMYLLSGLLWRLGLDLRASLLLWTPIAAAVLAGGVLAYLRRLLRPGEMFAATALALFFFSPVLPALVWSGAPLSAHNHAALLLTSGEAMPAWQMWGYLHTVIVMGLMALSLLGVERVLSADRRAEGRSARWYVGWTSAAGCLIGWLHPWQGLVLLAVMLGVSAWGRFARRYRPLAIPALATLAPMVYLYVLTRANHDWRIFSLQNRAFHDPLWVLLAALLPLVVPAIAGIRRRIREDQERMLLLWPAASLLVYFVVGQFPFHALQGISIPLAVLAVRGWRRLRARSGLAGGRLPGVLGLACVGLLTLPGMAFQLDTFRTNVEHPYAPYWLTNGENAALRYLQRSPGHGGVLSRYYLGMTVPAFTGRSTWVGHYVWTPQFSIRVSAAEGLFNGALPPASARRLVLSSGAAYLLTDCETRFDPTPELRGLIASTHRFGCAAVYRLRP
jgi:hypothetical protein